MRQLLPSAVENVDVYSAYGPSGGELLRLNMVSSADGAATDDQCRTAKLGGQGDLLVFRTLRALADAIVVGAGTVRAEGYGPHRPLTALADRRVGEGRPPTASLVVVSGSLDLDFDAPLFRDARQATVVVTCASAAPDRLAAARAAGQVVVAGESSVDLTAAMAQLRAAGFAHLLCEGGPTLNTGLLAAGLVDELCLTVAPQLLAAGRRIVSAPAGAAGLELLSVLESDSELYLRYRILRKRHDP